MKCEVWKKERRFHQLNSRADDTEAFAIAVFELRGGGGRRGGAGRAPGAPRPQRRQPCITAPGLGRRRSGNACVTRPGGLLIKERRERQCSRESALIWNGVAMMDVALAVMS